jgi:hypothetical protein
VPFRKVLGLVVAGVLVLLIAPAAAAQSNDEATPGAATFTIEVSVGLQGYAHPDQPIPVVVDITSEELIVGRLDVGAGGATQRTAIEVPANSAKQYVVYGAAPGDRRNVTVNLVRVVDGVDEVLDRQSVRLVLPSGELLVGLLGQDVLTTTLRSSVSSPLGTDVVPLPVAAAALSRGGGPLAYLVVDTGAFAELDDLTVDALSSWVRGGGRVIGAPAALDRIAATGGGEVLDRTPAEITRLSEGELIAVSDLEALDVDQWGALLRDTPPLGLVRTDPGFVPATGSLVAAATAGREASVPALPWLLIGIALFIVLVGPVNFLLLRRTGKPEWAWATVPLLSVVFVAAFWIIGRTSLQDFTVTSATVVIDDGTRTTAATALVVQVEQGGDHELELPPGWQPGPSASGVGVEAGTARVDDDGRTVYEWELNDLGVGAAEADWQAPPVDVDLTVAVDGRQIEVTATNQTVTDFWAWGIVVDGVASASANPLEVGAADSVSVRNFGGSNYSYEPVISTAVQRRLFYVDDFDRADFAVVAGLAGRIERELPSIKRDGIYFFGFADGTLTSVAVDGVAGEAEGTSLLLKQTELDAAVLAGLGEAQPDVLSVIGASSVENYGDGRLWAYGAEEVVFGYVIPVGVAGPLRVEPRGSQFAAVAVYDWTSGAFVDVEWGSDLAAYQSRGGEVVVRARPDETGFFDEGILLSRYAIKWDAGT